MPHWLTVLLTTLGGMLVAAIANNYALFIRQGDEIVMMRGQISGLLDSTRRDHDWSVDINRKLEDHLTHPDCR